MISMSLGGFEDTALALIAEGQELLKRAQQRAGEEKFLFALDVLVQHYHAEIIRFCDSFLQASGVGGVEGEDVAQEVFLAAYKRMPSFEPQASLRTWLYQIARHICAHMLRDERRHLESMKQNQAIVADRAHGATEIPMDERLQYQEWLERVQASLPKLRESDRVILVLAYMSDLTTEQIAEILMIKPQEVRTRRSRALQRLRRLVHHEEQ
jgi:RNA polymerase sigma-70 factor (ECF subfamily)